MPDEMTVDAVVVGAGVVGLASARALAQRGLETLVVERHLHIGEETSSRNSSVIHSGIYYPTGSLKAQLCVSGRESIYTYCASRGIAHSRCGKLIVAQEEEAGPLRQLRERARANGVTDLVWLESSDLKELEPQVQGAAALYCPSTGILDVHELMTALHGDLEQAGGMVAFDTELLGARQEGAIIRMDLRSGSQPMALRSRWLVNAAGLQALDVLNRIAGYPRSRIPELFFAKGNYFELRGASPFKHLVYPLPNEAGLGIHATLDLAGRIRFGPDVQWVDSLDYQVDPSRATQFRASIRRYWPALSDEALAPAFCGIRPKLAGPGMSAADFRIDLPGENTIPGLINLLGIESPGLTAALAIGEYVTRHIDR